MEDNLLMGRESCGLLRGFFTILAYNDHLLEECIYSLATADIWSGEVSWSLAYRDVIVGQRGLKYTEHKPFGRRYLGVTHTKMSSAC